MQLPLTIIIQAADLDHKASYLSFFTTHGYFLFIIAIFSTRQSLFSLRHCASINSKQSSIIDIDTTFLSLQITII
jgi:hypothetical protein